MSAGITNSEYSKLSVLKKPLKKKKKQTQTFLPYQYYVEENQISHHESE